VPKPGTTKNEAGASPPFIFSTSFFVEEKT